MRFEVEAVATVYASGCCDIVTAGKHPEGKGMSTESRSADLNKISCIPLRLNYGSGTAPTLITSVLLFLKTIVEIEQCGKDENAS